MRQIATDRLLKRKKILHDDRWVTADLVDVRFNNGQEIRDFLRIKAKNGGFVSVAARLSDGRFLLTRQCKPVAGLTVEAIAGGRESGEIPEKTAVREMLEETGYKPGRLIPIGQKFYPMTDRADNPCHLFLAVDCVPSRKSASGDEIQGVEFLLLWPGQVRDLIAIGEIKDLATLAGIFAHFLLEIGRL